MGWIKAGDEKLVPRLMTLDTIPKACNENVSCSWKSACTTLRCDCKKLNSCAPVFMAVQSAIVRTLIAKTNPPVKQ